MPVALVFCWCVGAVAQSNYLPPDGMVPNAETAIKVARAVFVAHFGEPDIELEEPLIAALVGDVWHVRGTMPPGLLGGVAEIELSKIDGRVLRLFHGR